MPCGFTHLFHGKSFFPIRFNISQHSRSPFSPKTSLDWSVVWLSHKAWITHEEQAAFPCPLCVSSHTESNSFQPKASIAQEWLANSCGSRPATGGGSQLWITILPTHRQPQPPHHFSLTRDTCMGHKSHPSPILWGHEQGEERDVGEKEQGRKELGWIGCWGGASLGLPQSWPCRNKVTQTGATAGEQLEHTGMTVWVVQEWGEKERVWGCRRNDWEWKTERLKIEAIKAKKHRRQEWKKGVAEKQLLLGFPLYPCNYSKSIHINI